ncbi:MAG: AsmA family protein, partial [Gracilimonas sp.]|nr:AsmA family protein [Gracilimonas sp.]
MKLFLKILAGFLVLVIVAVAGLRIYFNDQRLRETVVPMISQQTGTDVRVESMSLSLFTTFPDAGISMKGFVLPDKEQNEIASLDELIFSVKILPLLSNEIQITELILKSPEIQYRIYENGTTNIDFLIASETQETPEEESGILLQVPELKIENGVLRYGDSVSEMEVLAKGINGQLALQFDRLIQTELDAGIQSLSVQMSGEDYINDLEVSLQQSSIIDLEQETLNIKDGSLRLYNLALQLSGHIDSWSSDAMNLNIAVSSSSDNFGELLGLIPPEFEEYVNNLETRGSLKVEGKIEGALSENELPALNFNIDVQEGYLKNPELPEAIQNISLSFLANNDQISIQNFSAIAAGNDISVSGMITSPLSENPGFDLEIANETDLSTIKDFYPIGELGVERLGGLLSVELSAKGTFKDPENAQVNGNMKLTKGILQYEGVPRPIEDIEAEVNASNRQIAIKRAKLKASDNSLELSGSINNPLDEKNRSVNINGDVNVDLSSLDEFYPVDEIDEELTELRGNLESQFVLRGKLEPFDVQKLLQNSNVKLSNGYIAHKSIGEPLRDISFSGRVSGTQVQIDQARFKTGKNSLAVKGKVQNYLSENPIFNLNIDGKAMLSDIRNYYSLQPWVEALNGSATLKLTAKGPAGDPLKIDLNGSLGLNEVNASGGELALDVKNLNGTLSVTPNELQLNNFKMGFGSSDIELSGKMKNYLSLIKEQYPPSQIPTVTGTYSSDYLNIDEMIDWDEETDPSAPIPLELPELKAQVNAEITDMNILGLRIRNIS